MHVEYQQWHTTNNLKAVLIIADYKYIFKSLP